MKEKNYTPDRAAKDFHSFCWKVIRCSVLNQLRGYVRHCMNFETVSLEETGESVTAVYDDIPEEKAKIPAGGTIVVIENELLADALLEMQDKRGKLFYLAQRLDIPYRR